MIKLGFLALIGLISIASSPRAICQVTVNTSIALTSLRGGVGFPFLEPFGNIKGEPCSLVRKTTTTRMLADGTTIKNERQERYFRDSEGRTRTEMSHVRLGEERLEFISVHDPVANTMIRISPDSKEAFVNHLPAPRPRTAAEEAEKEERRAKVEAERIAKVTPEQRDSLFGVPLGQKGVDGVLTEGRRFIRIIPVGQRDNDRELHIVVESWVSPDLKIEMEYTSDDPIEGKMESLVSELQRAEPDPSLFKVPDSYKVTEKEMPVVKALHR